MKTVVTSVENGRVRKTKIGKPKKSFTAIIKEGNLMMNLSYGSTEAKDDEGNVISLNLWVTGDWKVEYKGREYLIPISENVNALIEWINENQS